MVVVIDVVKEPTREAVFTALVVNDDVLDFDRVAERLPVDEILDVLLTEELADTVRERTVVLETRGDRDKLGVPVLVREALVVIVIVGVCDPVLDALELNVEDLVGIGTAVDDADPVIDGVLLDDVVILAIVVRVIEPDFVRVAEGVFVANPLYVEKAEDEDVTDCVLVLTKEPLLKAEAVTVFVQRFEADVVIETVDVFD
jgi:hypothetical protein